MHGPVSSNGRCPTYGLALLRLDPVAFIQLPLSDETPLSPALRMQGATEITIGSAAERGQSGWLRGLRARTSDPLSQRRITLHQGAYLTIQ
jgi:hypothetical protein